MNTSRLKVELALLRMRAAHKEIELDEALRTGWGWRTPRLQLWALNMLIEEAEEDARISLYDAVG